METPKKQTQTLRKLIAIQKDLPLDSFYRISFDNWGDLTLQGHFNKELIVWGAKHRFSFDVHKTLGYIMMKKYNVEIVLT